MNFIMNFIDLFNDVFEPVAISYAFASGILTGATLLLFLTLRFPQRNPMTTKALFLVTGTTLLILGTIFFAGQVSQAVITGDELWPRIFARFGLWCVFSVSSSLGLAFTYSFAHGRVEEYDPSGMEQRLNDRADVRADQAHDQALKEHALNQGIKATTDDTRKRVIIIQKKDK